jgi:GTP-binding protein EngB required for normal cell division
MTAGGPPWQVFGSDSAEPETAEPAKPAPERPGPAGPWPPTAKAGPVKTAPPVKAKPPWDLSAAGSATAAPGTAEPGTAEPGPATPAAATPAAAAAPAKARPPWELATAAEPATAEPVTVAPATAPGTSGPVAPPGPVAAPGPATPPTAPWPSGPATAPWPSGPAPAAPATAAPPWELPEAGPPWPEPGLPESGSPAPGLPDRLAALSRLIEIASARAGTGGVSEDLLGTAEALVSRADERLRLSAGHTVVALAGGTGGGKSSIFNYLAGADFSAVGVTRPVTRDAHACVWGADGSGPLLEWLGVARRYRYSRGSALDRGETSLNGLVLLDLPDHDSVFGETSDQVGKLIGMADLMVWVLDPQKYADASVHRHYLVPLAGHSEVIAVVLNQADLLSDAQVEECASDLRRLLDSEGLHQASMVVTSAVTGSGMDQLRKLLTETVSERRASAARISADLDDIAAEFAPYAKQAETAAASQGRPPAAAAPGATAEAGPDVRHVPTGVAAELVDAFARSVGVSAVADTLQSARELRALDYVGWPVAWLAERLTGRDPTRKIRLGRLWAEVKSMASGPSDAQQAEIDHALTRLADEIGPSLPAPWAQTTRTAVRSRADQIPAALGTAMTKSLPDENKIPVWWRLIGGLQGLLLGGVVVSLAWILALLIFGVFHAASNVPRLFSDASLLPLIIVLLGAFLLLGWLTAAGSRTVVRAAAEQENERAQESMRAKIAEVAREMVISPVEQELAEYGRFRDEYRVVAGS